MSGEPCGEMLKVDDGVDAKVIAKEHEDRQPFLERLHHLIPPRFNAASSLQHFEASDFFSVLS